MAKKKTSSPETITDALREAIDGCGLSSYALGKESGVEQNMIRRFMHGERDLRLGTVDRLAAALGLKLVVATKPKG